MYVSGYHLSPGIWLKKKGKDVLVCAYIQLHEGILDSVLQWPFDDNVGLTIKHPLRGKDCHSVDYTSKRSGFFGRPDNASNKGTYFDGCPFRLDQLERGGYVVEDRLRVIWKLVPRN